MRTRASAASALGKRNHPATNAIEHPATATVETGLPFLPLLDRAFAGNAWHTVAGDFRCATEDERRRSRALDYRKSSPRLVFHPGYPNYDPRKWPVVWDAGAVRPPQGETLGRIDDRHFKIELESAKRDGTKCVVDCRYGTHCVDGAKLRARQQRTAAMKITSQNGNNRAGWGAVGRCCGGGDHARDGVFVPYTPLHVENADRGRCVAAQVQAVTNARAASAPIWRGELRQRSALPLPRLDRPTDPPSSDPLARRPRRWLRTVRRVRCPPAVRTSDRGLRIRWPL